MGRLTGFSGLSLKFKLIAVIFTASVFVMVVGLSVVVFFNTKALKTQRMDAALEKLAVLNQDFVKLLIMNSADLSADMILRFRSIKTVQLAVVYDVNNNIVFNYYKNDEFQNIIPPRKPVSEIKGENIQIYEPVISHGQIYGQVYMLVNIEGLQLLLRQHFQLMAVLTPFLLLVSYLLALWLQRYISTPILQLRKLVSDTTQDQDFSRKLQPIHNDEVGQLIAGFNSLFARIQSTQTALKESEANLSQAQKIAHIGSWVWDVGEENFAEWSAETYRIFGVDPVQYSASAEILQKSINPRDWQYICSSYKSIVKKRLAMSLEFRIEAENGLYRCVWAQAEPRSNQQGRVNNVVGTVQDITERKIIEEELRKHKEELEELVTQRTLVLEQQAKIIDQIHDSVVSTDMQGNVRSWNKGAERLFGYTAEHATGKHISFLYPQEQHECLQSRVIQPLQEKGNLEVEEVMRKSSGEDFYAHLSLAMVYDDRDIPNGMISYAMDISERKKAENLLNKRTEELAKANLELEAFSYSVSHDLRAPLRSIEGFSTALVEDCADQLDETAENYLFRIRKNAHKMSNLIDDLLQFSQVTRSKINIERLDLSAMANEILYKLQQDEPGRHTDVAVQDGLFVRADRRLFEIVLNNLLQNAWKYTSKTGHAKIQCGAAPNGENKLYFVRDNGAGFDMKYADKLFDAFQRLHSDDEYPGTGVGLTTVERIIQRHGGEIWAEADVGKGATFYFSLPDA